MDEVTNLSDSESEVNIECSTKTKRSKPTKKRKQPETKENEKGEKKKGRQSSWVWDHFDRDPNKDEYKATCQYCSTVIGCHPINAGTGALNNHLSRCKEYPANKDMKQKVLAMDKRVEGEGSNKLISWSYNKEVCRSKLARMVVIDELPFSFVEGEGFIDFCHSMCPSFEPVSRRTICRDILKLCEGEKETLKNMFSKSSHSVCLTTDTWTSIQTINYMVLTAHFVDDDWKLHKRIIIFCVITDHKGESIGKLIVKCIKEWGIKRVLTITVDNASANEVAINYVKKELKESNGCVLDGEFMHVRCCAHILNLIVNDGLKDIQYSVANIRSVVKYVRSSPSRLAKFKKFVNGLNILDKTALALDVQTRWNSTYLMLDAALKYQKAFEQMEEEDGLFISYFKEVETPNVSDWENAKVFIRFLKTFYDVTLKFSCTLSITSNTCLVELVNIDDEISDLSSSEDVLLRNMASSMKLKYDKYWGSMSNMNKILLISCVLDPRYKMQFVSVCLEDAYGGEDSLSLERAMRELKDLLIRLFEWYSAKRAEFESTNEPSIVVSLQQEASATGSSSKKMEKRYKRIHTQDASANEVEKYLNEVVEVAHKNFDVQGWWKINSSRYKVLADIARDVFAIPVSTVASESAFSTGGRILDPFRSCLTPKMVEVLVTLQNWIKSKPIHIDHRIEMPIEDLEYYDEILTGILV